jgi:hypothetical protein
MVDVGGRRRAAALVAQIRDGFITNDEFEDSYPMHSKDRALFAVFMDVWSLYESVRPFIRRADYEQLPQTALSTSSN